MVSDDEVYDFGRNPMEEQNFNQKPSQEPLISAEVGARITNGSKTTLPTGELEPMYSTCS